jgi:dihydropteroate synthase
MERVHEAVAEGADIVGVCGVADGAFGGVFGEREEVRRVVPFIATVRDAYPELVIGVGTGRVEVAREACAAGADVLLLELLDDVLSGQLLGVAGEFGAGVLCSPALAARAVRAGVEPERVVVEAKDSRQVADLVATGWPVLVSLPAEDLGEDVAADVAGDLARAAVLGWLGARVFRVGRVRETRQVLSMVSAIRGDIPPAYAMRGLA